MYIPTFMPNLCRIYADFLNFNNKNINYFFFETLIDKKRVKKKQKWVVIRSPRPTRTNDLLERFGTLLRLNYISNKLF